MKLIRNFMSLFILALILLPSGSLLTPQSSSAATAEACGKAAGGFLSFPTWYKYLEPSFEDLDGPTGPDPGECTISLPEDNQGNQSVLLAATPIGLAIFEILLRIASLIAIGFVIYGGIQYIISQGEPERIKNARTTIINALIGMVITIFSSAIVNLIGNNIS